MSYVLRIEVAAFERDVGICGCCDCKSKALPEAELENASRMQRATRRPPDGEGSEGDVARQGFTIKSGRIADVLSRSFRSSS
jgi:hypothetical protein